MRILFHLHAYPPELLAGAETMARRIAKFLKGKGHEIKVYSQTAKSIQFIDEIQVKPYDTSVDDDSDWQWADLVITHLGATAYCLNKSRFWKKKLVNLIHNSFFDQLTCCRVANNYLVYNSPYVKRELESHGYTHPNVICIPPVDYREYEDVQITGEYITLVNLNENKGGKIFIELAKRLPQYKFLGVTGGYYEQHKQQLPNLTYIPPQGDIKKAYQKTKLLLMPSEYESWGQVAIEALSCGIPVISSKAQGLCEALGYAGMNVERDNMDGWIASICAIMEDKDRYDKLSFLAKKRAKDLDPTPYLEELNSFLVDINQRLWQQ